MEAHPEGAVALGLTGDGTFDSHHRGSQLSQLSEDWDGDDPRKRSKSLKKSMLMRGSLWRRFKQESKNARFEPEDDGFLVDEQEEDDELSAETLPRVYVDHSEQLRMNAVLRAAILTKRKTPEPDFETSLRSYAPTAHVSDGQLRQMRAQKQAARQKRLGGQRGFPDVGAVLARCGLANDGKAAAVHNFLRRNGPAKPTAGRPVDHGKSAQKLDDFLSVLSTAPTLPQIMPKSF